CEDLEPLVAEYESETGHQFKVVQVKEKFGGLRFYVEDANEVMRQRIELAELKSFKTCEACGNSGQRRSHGRIQTLCDEHAFERTTVGRPEKE
ncbi:MAG: hypothetical protein WCE63_07880, partial [Acidobacteriaceae bacterium]